MSDPTPATNAATTGGNKTGTTSTGNAFTAITTQADLDKLIGERVARERGKYADYADLKAKASEFDKLEEANKTEAQKQADALLAAQKVAEKATADALRFKVQAKFKIDDDDATLFLTGTDEATLTKQAERLAERVADRKQKGNHVPREGRNPTSGDGGELGEFTRQLFHVTD